MSVARLRALVEAESPSGDRERIAIALDLIDGWASAALGRPARRVTVDGVDHLLWPATGEPSTLLLGHVDTVWPAGTLAERPFTLEDGIARGPGIFDMKAGLIAALGALERVEDPGRVALLVTSDEEVGSPTSRRLIESTARTASAVLVLEPSQDGALKTVRRGASIYRVSFDGIEAHAGLEPEKGASALVELAHQVLALGELADPGLGTSVTPTRASAGTTTNTVAACGALDVDVRAFSEAELRRVHEQIGALEPFDPRVAISVTGGINRPPLERRYSRELFALAQHVAGREIDEASVGGGSDGNFTAALGVPTLDGLGPRGGGAHHRSEWVALESVDEQAVLIAALLDALAVGHLGTELTA